jgi:hypothetical protein
MEAAENDEDDSEESSEDEVVFSQSGIEMRKLNPLAVVKEAAAASAAAEAAAASESARATANLPAADLRVALAAAVARESARATANLPAADLRVALAAASACASANLLAAEHLALRLHESPPPAFASAGANSLSNGKRIADNGFAYTKEEFIGHYGGVDEWLAAEPHVSSSGDAVDQRVVLAAAEAREARETTLTQKKGVSSHWREWSKAAELF